MKEIFQKTDPVLRKKAKEVPLSDIGTPKLNKILKDMGEALEAKIDGVAIAAPQIGVSLRIFIVSHRAFQKEDEIKEEKPQREAVGAPTSDVSVGAGGVSEKKYKNTIFINPKITKLSKDKSKLEEGCLSVRYAYGKIMRSNKATVRARNEAGEVFERGASGLLAQIFQHETDHLDGILFIDKATEIEEIPPEEIQKVKAKSQNFK